MDATDDK